MGNEQVSILLVGAGGYGNNFVRELLADRDSGTFLLAGIVELYPENCKYYEQLLAMNVPFYSDMESFYKEHHADLAIVTTPIQYHCAHTCTALRHGSNVLCEKPIAATEREVRLMMEESARAGKFVAIGYNWSYYEQFLELKQDIVSGRFGKPKRLKSLVLWPRAETYYESGWKGRRKSQQGEWILDSIAHNATSHHLHNMLYMLGASIETSGRIDRVEAELYKANPIETFDTCAARIWVNGDVEVLYYAAHAVPQSVEPRFCFEFENALITFVTGEQNNRIVAHMSDGTVVSYEPREGKNGWVDGTKLWTCIEAVRNGGANIPCGLEASLPQVQCMSGMLESAGEASTFPEELMRKDQERRLLWVDGLDKTLLACYENGVLPSEAGALWAVKGNLVHITDNMEYRHLHE
ncbi:Gfo/Idh/MocA family protein [Paenibacillus thalictri]|uniref:Gfo/Idh/MocA family oxidoreductase n=1 Tax=Paenibacillus thalictri TaxID=2527873 RepID=A0A4Q9DX36_9BACL|nr:Gfo/Idh/MocA family oxidoreductase [Paenibacillus thalictri]TBL80327.1 Gfo/Idh/MocA family oxidoreductase [Paenibacillus thalictri]